MNECRCFSSTWVWVSVNECEESVLLKCVMNAKTPHREQDFFIFLTKQCTDILSISFVQLQNLNSCEKIEKTVHGETRQTEFILLNFKSGVTLFFHPPLNMLLVKNDKDQLRNRKSNCVQIARELLVLKDQEWKSYFSI
jgi:hypothetical protein